MFSFYAILNFFVSEGNIILFIQLYVYLTAKHSHWSLLWWFCTKCDRIFKPVFDTKQCFFIHASSMALLIGQTTLWIEISQITHWHRVDMDNIMLNLSMSALSI